MAEVKRTKAAETTAPKIRKTKANPRKRKNKSKGLDGGKPYSPYFLQMKL
jgi:hypothetical protein